MVLNGKVVDKSGGHSLIHGAETVFLVKIEGDPPRALRGPQTGRVMPLPVLRVSAAQTIRQGMSLEQISGETE